MVAPTIAGLEIMAPENCSQLFASLQNLKSIDFTNFNTENVTNMSDMFYYCTSLESLDLSGFNTENVTTMEKMFLCCMNIESLDLSSFSSKNLANTNLMFAGCESLKSITIPASVTYIGMRSFCCCDKLTEVTLNSIPDLGADFFDESPVNSITLNLSDDSYVASNLDNFPALTTKPTYTRTMKNQWGTIVLPFDVTIDSKNPYDFYEIASVNGDELSLSKMSGTLSAGTPALIRIYSDKVNGKTYELNISAADNNIDVSGDLTKSAGSLSLVGAYDYKDITAENGYIISNNAFWSIQDVKGENNVYCAPFRSYIAGTTSSSRLRIGDVDDESTGIAALDALNSADAEYYDINGRKQDGLKNGVNIIKANGKTMKVIVK